jgi:hypothetical protein
VAVALRPDAHVADQVRHLLATLDAAAAKYDAVMGKDLAAINAELAKKKLEPITRLTQEDWGKKTEN